MPNMMAALRNIGGADEERSSVICFLVTRRKVWLTHTVRVPGSKFAANIGERKTWTQSEFCIWQNSVNKNKKM